MNRVIPTATEGSADDGYGIVITGLHNAQIVSSTQSSNVPNPNDYQVPLTPLR